ncbi:hypothetical protein NXT3_CH02716 [Sinorhizobium fredii]|uniref:Uncharacterized protein n=1 Tax=Rhizobium fredii TaxID=380 RepID=A0A2L0H711_RHIFR|nr:hypothetical protein NXT3_CH02716 [Sinorhizobium fredii]
MQGRHGVPHVVSTVFQEEAGASCLPNARPSAKKTERDAGEGGVRPSLVPLWRWPGRRPFPNGAPAPWEPHLM